MVAKKSNNISLKAKIFLAMLALVIIVVAGTGINYYLKYFKPNVTGNTEYLYIPTGSDFKDVYSIISSENIVNDTLSFPNAAQNMDYPVKVKAGRYRLTKRYGQPVADQYA